MLWKIITKEIGLRPSRTILTLLSVTIGIASIVAASMGTATTREAYRRMYDEISGRSALQVSAEGGTLFEEDLVERIGRVDGVQAAVPSLQRRTKLFFQQQHLDLMILGVDPAREPEVRDYELRDGRMLESNRDEGSLLEVGFAQGAGIGLGDQVKLLTPRGRLKSVTVVGLLSPRGVAAFNKGGTIVLGLHQAERSFGKLGQINTIDVVLTPGTKEEPVAAAIREILPPGLMVHPPAARTQLAAGTAVEIEQGLLFASGFALVLGLLIIVNTFLMNTSERRPQLAILRAVGATRGQVVRMLLLEGLLIGVPGTLLGCLLGIGGGYLIMQFITGIYVSSPPPVVMPVEPLVMAAVLGPVLALAAAAVPAWLASRIPPLEAMQPVVSQRGTGVPRWLTALGVVASIVSALVLAATVRGGLPDWLAVSAGVILIAVFVLLIPALLHPLSRVVGWLLRPVFGLEAVLADRQIRRRPVRNGLTIGVVYIAMCVGVGLGTTIINTVDDIRAWYRQTVQGDFFVRGAMPDTATGQTVEIPMSIGDEIRKIPGVANLDSVKFFKIDMGANSILVVARDFTDPVLPVSLYDADPAHTRRQLTEGEVVIGTVLARELGLKTGDEIEVEKTREGAKRFRVAATAIDYMVGGFIMYIHRPLAERYFRIQGADAFAVTVAPDQEQPVHEALIGLARENGLMVQSIVDLNRMLDQIMAGVIGALWAILAMSFVVAAFGIANTLTMNVIEQTRELALLRVVAMTRGQVRRLVMAQAAIIGVIGLALGTALGLNTAKAISMAMMPLLGYPLPFSPHLGLIVGCAALGLLLVVLVALLPARRAARLDLLIALQYE